MTTRRVLTWGAGSVLAGVLALFLWGLANGQSNFPHLAASGQRPLAPTLALPRISEHGSVRLTDLRGSIVVVNFWRSDCVPCREEAPVLNAAAARLRPRGVRFLGVAINDSFSAARAFAKKYDVHYDLVHDDGGVEASWGVGGQPETFVIDRTGHATTFYALPMTPEKLDELVRSAEVPA